MSTRLHFYREGDKIIQLLNQRDEFGEPQTVQSAMPIEAARKLHQDLSEALSIALSTPQRWTDAEIERVAMDRYPVDLFQDMADIDMNRLKREQFIRDAKFLRDHALLSGEGEVGCFTDDGMVNIHKESETCDVCVPAASREPVAYLDIVSMQAISPKEFAYRHSIWPQEYAHWIPVFAAPSTREKEMEEALRVAMKSLATYGPHVLIEMQANKALNTPSDGK